MSVGRLVINKQLEFSVNNITMTEGKFILHASSNDCPALEDGLHFVEVFDNEGAIVVAYHISMGWEKQAPCTYIWQSIKLTANGQGMLF